MKHIFSLLALTVVIVTMAACSTPPYVYKSGEFNRASPVFGQPARNIYDVTICYSSSNATPQQVTKLAVDECAAFNKTAEFTKQSYNVCPLVAPIAAIYECQGQGNARASGDGQSVPGGTLMNYDGIEFRY